MDVRGSVLLHNGLDSLGAESPLFQIHWLMRVGIDDVGTDCRLLVHVRHVNAFPALVCECCLVKLGSLLSNGFKSSVHCRPK